MTYPSPGSWLQDLRRQQAALSEVIETTWHFIFLLVLLQLYSAVECYGCISLGPLQHWHACRWVGSTETPFLSDINSPFLLSLCKLLWGRLMGSHLFDACGQEKFCQVWWWLFIENPANLWVGFKPLQPLKECQCSEEYTLTRIERCYLLASAHGILLRLIPTSIR